MCCKCLLYHQSWIVINICSENIRFANQDIDKMNATQLSYSLHISYMCGKCLVTFHMWMDSLRLYLSFALKIHLSQIRIFCHFVKASTVSDTSPTERSSSGIKLTIVFSFCLKKPFPTERSSSGIGLILFFYLCLKKTFPTVIIRH